MIKWDQKEGGMQEYAYPNLKLKPKDAMNIYNLHRTRSILPGFASIRLKLDTGEQYNVCSFFSGFGGTSPDGFTGNYGKNTIGISEKVIALFLPMEIKSQEYWEVLMKISARILISQENIGARMEKIVKLIVRSGLVDKVDQLREYLESYMDRELGLNSEFLAIANDLEVKGLHHYILDLRDQIKHLTINPAATAFQADAQKIAQAKEDQQKIRDLLTQINQLNTQKSVIQAVDSQKDELIETMKQDYVKIFGTLTDQIMQLEGEIKGISESTQGLLQDLNTALAEKIKYIQELEEQIKTLSCK